MPEELSVEQRLHLWADELRAIANDGLHWMADNPCTKWRHCRLTRTMAIASATPSSGGAVSYARRSSTARVRGRSAPSLLDAVTAGVVNRD
jgi:hypothetical protein